jgi:hypothetical protein
VEDFIALEGKGIDDTMDLKRSAMKAGITGEEAYAIQTELKKGGQTEREANATIQQAGAMATKLQDIKEVAGVYTAMQKKLALSDNVELMDLIPFDYLASKPSAPELMQRVVEVTSDLSPQDRKLYLESVGMGSLLSYDDKGKFSNAENLTSTMALPEETALAANAGIVTAETEYREVAMDSVSNNVDGANLQGMKQGIHRALSATASGSSEYGKIVKAGLAIGLTAADMTYGSETQKSISEMLGDTMDAFSPQMDKEGNMQDPTIGKDLLEGFTDHTALGRAASSSYNTLSSSHAAVMDGVGDYFDGVSRRFDAGTGDGTGGSTAIPAKSIGAIPTPKSSKDDKLESNVSVIVNNNADGNEVHVDDNGEDSTFFNWFTK